MFPGEMGNRRTKTPIIRKNFLAVFAVQLEFGSNKKEKKNLTSKANPETIQFAEPQATAYESKRVDIYSLRLLKASHQSFQYQRVPLALLPQQGG